MKNYISGLYSRLYEKSPGILKNALSRCSFEVTKKPWINRSSNVNLDRWPNDCKGVLVISADLELAWGWRFSRGREDPVKMASKARSNFPLMIRLFDAYGIPITWATVGHLFLKKCEKSSHGWMQRIPFFKNTNWKYDNGDWFKHDPCTNWQKAKAWYAPDLIERILNSKVDHEVGCHTFSHIDFTDGICPPGVADDELKACEDAASKWGIKLRSFVFAAGTYGNFDILRKHHYTNYRRRLSWELSRPFLDDEKLVILPSSCSLQGDSFGWSREYHLYRLKKYVDRAVATGTICHFWFHPSLDGRFVRSIFPDLLRYAAKLRDQDMLWITTMGDLADYVQGINNER